MTQAVVVGTAFRRAKPMGSAQWAQVPKHGSSIDSSARSRTSSTVVVSPARDHLGPFVAGGAIGVVFVIRRFEVGDTHQLVDGTAKGHQSVLRSPSFDDEVGPQRGAFAALQGRFRRCVGHRSHRIDGPVRRRPNRLRVAQNSWQCPDQGRRVYGRLRFAQGRHQPA